MTSGVISSAQQCFRMKEASRLTDTGKWKVHITSGYPCACEYNDQFDLIGYVYRFDW